MPLRAVAVFGSSEPLPGEPDYELARRAGRLLAAAGLAVVTGGYGGVMEAASRGAREAGGRSVGVTCGIFGAREPNGWLDEVVPTADLFERTRVLCERADGFLVLPGRAGTLAELAFLWALERAACLGPRPVVVLGGSWRSLIRALDEAGVLEPAQLAITRLADDPEQAAALLRRGIEHAGESE